MPSPRTLKTHLPVQMLPPSFWKENSKVTTAQFHSLKQKQPVETIRQVASLSQGPHTPFCTHLSFRVWLPGMIGSFPLCQLTHTKREKSLKQSRGFLLEGGLFIWNLYEAGTKKNSNKDAVYLGKPV